MRTNTDPERDDALLDAMLCDESWQAASAAFKAEALRDLPRPAARSPADAMGGRRGGPGCGDRGRAHWLGWRAAAPRPVTLAHAEVPKAPGQPADNSRTQSWSPPSPKGVALSPRWTGRRNSSSSIRRSNAPIWPGPVRGQLRGSGHRQPTCKRLQTELNSCSHTPEAWLSTWHISLNAEALDWPACTSCV